MKKNKSTISFLIIIFLSITSCSIIGFNIKRKTPSKPAKLPIFTEADTLRGKLTKFKTCYDVTFYNINLDVDIKNKYINGLVDIQFKALDDLDTIQIDLFENLKINKIICKSENLNYQRKFNAVFIFINKKIKKGEIGNISVYYEGKPIEAPRPPWDGGFVWKKDKNKNPWIGVACELSGASLWWPLKDHLSDEPDSLKMNITIPKGLFCVSNGKLISRIVKDNKETFVWKTSYPINSYNASIYIGNFVHFSIPYIKKDTTYDLDFYVLPQNLEKAKTHFTQSVDIIKFYEEKFGEYPWWKDGYKLVESPYAGMEHQTAIAYGDKYKNHLDFNFDYIILHETAHEWWGNSLTVNDVADIWLHEGFATYSEALYVEATKGHEAYMNYINFYSIFVKNKKTVIGPFDVNYWNYKDGDVYVKGALILHTLRNVINNDSIFFDIIKTYYNKFKYSNVVTNDFINIVNEKTNLDYNWFFEQYLYNRYCPQLKFNYYFNYKTSKVDIKYKWNNVNDNFKLPVTMQLPEKEIILYPSKEIQTITYDGGIFEFNKINSYISYKKDTRL